MGSFAGPAHRPSAPHLRGLCDQLVNPLVRVVRIVMDQNELLRLGQIGDLNKVKRIVKVLGMVNAVPTFDQQPKVINGFSDFMVEVFGVNGKHARSAGGVGSLPNNIPVEIEMIVELK